MAQDSNSIPAPVGGWNTKDSPDFMDVIYARELTNWFPETDRCVTRKGCREHASGMGASVVETVASLMQADGTETLICGANSNLYNATTFDTSASSIGSGYSNNRWQHTTFRNLLWLCNGEDIPVYWDGSSLTTTTWGSAQWVTSTSYTSGDQVRNDGRVYQATTTGTSGATAPTHTSGSVSDGGVTWLFLVDTRHFIHVAEHKNRLYWTEKDSGSFWYGEPNSITGEITEFDASSIFTNGGNVVGVASISRDTGGGDANQLVIFGSNGEALLYVGSFPGDADWIRTRRVKIPQLQGRRSWERLGSDFFMLTRAGLYAFNEFLAGKPAGTETPYSDKINKQLKEWGKSYATNYGWSVVNFDDEQKLIVNVPKTSTTSFQVVFNTLTGAGCLYNGINAKSWCVHKNNVYYGGTDGKVYQAEYGYDDCLEPISHILKQAYSYANDRKHHKRFDAVKPLLETTVSTTIDVGLDTDFNNSTKMCEFPLFKETTNWGSSWGSSWSAPSAVHNRWEPMQNSGTNYSLKLAGQVNGGQVGFISSRIMYDRGGVKG